MTIYSAPLLDMQFAIQEFGGFDDWQHLEGAEDWSAELLEAILDQASKFANGVLSPLNRTGDMQGAQWVDGRVLAPDGFRDAYQQFIAAGWSGLSADPLWGGQGLPYSLAMMVQEIWNSANMAFCLCPMLTTGVQETLKRHGSAQLQNSYLRKLVSGEWTGTMNLTEPQAGSDLSAIRTRAVPEDDYFRITGTKIYITWGAHDLAENIVHLVLARLPDAPEGVKGISLFVVPQYLPNAEGECGEMNDVRCVSIERKLGIHASPTCVMSYGDHKGAIGYLVGEPHHGLGYMFTMMNHARLGVGVEGLAIAESAYQQALLYARSRVQGRLPGVREGERVSIIELPDVKRMLLTMRASIDAMRALCCYMAGMMDRSHRHHDHQQRIAAKARLDLLNPVAKGWCTENAVDLVSMAMQVHGGTGYIEATGIAQCYRDIRITTIYEGTTAIQANDLVNRKLGLDGGADMLALIDEMRGLKLNIQVADNQMQLLIDHYLNALLSFERATKWVVSQSRHPMAVAAVAVTYMRMTGIVVGAWLMLRGASRLNTKMSVARFYIKNVLPQVSAYEQVIIAGASSTLDFDSTLL